MLSLIVAPAWLSVSGTETTSLVWTDLWSISVDDGLWNLLRWLNWFRPNGKQGWRESALRIIYLVLSLNSISTTLYH